MAENTEKLFDMFPPISTEEWKAKIITDLKGADFDKKLVWRTNEGFNVQPFYRAEDIEGLYTLGSMPGQFPYVRGTRDKNTWLIRQQIQGETAEEMNRNAVHVSTVVLTLAASSSTRISTLPISLPFSATSTSRRWKSTSTLALSASRRLLPDW